PTPLRSAQHCDGSHRAPVRSSLTSTARFPYRQLRGCETCPWAQTACTSCRHSPEADIGAPFRCARPALWPTMPPGRSYAPGQAAKTTLFAAENEARYRKNRLRFFPVNEGVANGGVCGSVSAPERGVVCAHRAHGLLHLLVRGPADPRLPRRAAEAGIRRLGHLHRPATGHRVRDF